MADCQNSHHHNKTNRDLPPPNPMPPPAAGAAPADDADDRILAGAVETAREIHLYQQSNQTYVQTSRNLSTERGKLDSFPQVRSI